MLYSCQDNPTIIESKSQVKKTENISYTIKLSDSSQYQIEIPSDYKMERGRRMDSKFHFVHPADTIIYSFSPTDSINKKYTVGNFHFGHQAENITPLYEMKVTKDSFISKELLQKRVKWKIYEYSSRLLTGETIINVNDSLKLYALLYAVNYPQLDSLLNMLQSLKRL